MKTIRIIYSLLKLLLTLMLPVLIHLYFINKFSRDIEYGVRKAKIINKVAVGKVQNDLDRYYLELDYQKYLLMDLPDGCKYKFHSDIGNVENSQYEIGDELSVFYIRMTDVSPELELTLIYSITIHLMNPRVWTLLLVIFLWLTLVIESGINLFRQFRPKLHITAAKQNGGIAVN